MYVYVAGGPPRVYIWPGLTPGVPTPACMYVYIYVYVCIYIRVYMFMWPGAAPRVYIHICGRGPHPGCIYTYVAGGRTSGANIYISIYIHIYIHVYTYMARGPPRVYMFIYGRGGPTPQGVHKYIAGGSLRYIYVFIYIYI